MCFRPHYGIFPTLLQVRTAVFKIIYVLSKALVPECTKSYYFILKHFYLYIFIHKYKAYVREYSLTKTYTLLLKFPGKGKIFQRKKNIKSYKSHQMTYLICHDELGTWCLENCSWKSYIKEDTRKYPWQPASSNLKSGPTNCHTDLIDIKLMTQKPVLER